MTAERLSLSVANRTEDLARAMEAAEAFLQAWSVEPQDQAQVMVLLDEIASNVIKAAWPDGGQRRFSLELSVEPAPLSLQLVLLSVDDGVPFDPTAAPAPDLERDLEDWEPGSLGLLMIHELSDSVAYSRADGRNRLTVTKRLGRAQEA